MDVTESIIKDLQNLPTAKLVEVVRFVYGFSEVDQKKCQMLLRQTHGILCDDDGRAFDAALFGARRLQA